MSTILPNGDRNSSNDSLLRPDGTPKVKFKTEVRQNNGALQKVVVINGEMLDWSVDLESLMHASRLGPEYFRAAQHDIEKHFIESVSEFLGRKVTSQDIQSAIKTGWI